MKKQLISEIRSYLAEIKRDEWSGLGSRLKAVLATIIVLVDIDEMDTVEAQNLFEKIKGHVHYLPIQVKREVLSLAFLDKAKELIRTKTKEYSGFFGFTISIFPSDRLAEDELLSFGFFVPKTRYSRKTLIIYKDGTVGEDVEGVLPRFDIQKNEPKIPSETKEELAKMVLSWIK